MKLKKNSEQEDFILLKENVELKISMVKNTIERMSLDCFTDAYLSHPSFHRLVIFFDEELSKVFESLLVYKKTEVEYMDIARKEFEDFLKEKKLIKKLKVN